MSFLKQYAGSESTTTPCHRICYRTRGVSPQQAEILTAIADGLSNAQIADRLGIGPDIVKVHVNALCTKLGAANRAEAVAIALRKHLLSI